MRSKQTNVITLKPLHLFCNFYDNCNNWRKKYRFEFYSMTYNLEYGYLPVKWVNAICSEHSLLLSVNLTIFSFDREKSSTGIKQNHNNEHNITFNLVTSINWTTVDWCKTSSVNCLVHMVLFVPTSCSMLGAWDSSVLLLF